MCVIHGFGSPHFTHWIWIIGIWIHLKITGAQEQNIMKVRVRKKVSILQKASEAPLFKYVN